MFHNESLSYPINASKWIDNNRHLFVPPVCNKLMHNAGQLKVMFVGGPNQRKDYHIECGEEFFYMLKGDMILKVVEQGKHRDIHIKEGEVFLLPAQIPHSPNRIADTLGMVIERERKENEKDGLRYYVEKDGAPTLESLYEAWFHCTDLGTQLVPIIKGFFASEQFKTGKPLPGTIPENPPVAIDTKRSLGDPFNFNQWIEKNSSEIQTNGLKMLFGEHHEFQIYVKGAGKKEYLSMENEVYIWQLKNSSQINFDDTKQALELKSDDTLLVDKLRPFAIDGAEESLALILHIKP